MFTVSVEWTIYHCSTFFCLSICIHYFDFIYIYITSNLKISRRSKIKNEHKNVDALIILLSIGIFVDLKGLSLSQHDIIMLVASVVFASRVI